MLNFIEQCFGNFMPAVVCGAIITRTIITLLGGTSVTAYPPVPYAIMHMYTQTAQAENHAC